MPDPNFRAWAEVAYFVSGVVLVAVAMAGLAQLVIARRALKAAEHQIAIASEAIDVARTDIRIRVRREAVTVAAEQCAKFGETILPAIEENVDRLKKFEISYVAWTLIDVEFQTGSVKEPQAADWLQKVRANRDARWLISDCLNKMEGFAIYFAGGAADEAIAYPVVGPVFCSYVEAFAPLLTELRQQRVAGIASGTYQNTIDLYRVWTSRAARMKLESQASTIEKQLASLPESTINPIGGA